MPIDEDFPKEAFASRNLMSTTHDLTSFLMLQEEKATRIAAENPSWTDAQVQSEAHRQTVDSYKRWFPLAKERVLAVAREHQRDAARRAGA